MLDQCSVRLFACCLCRQWGIYGEDDTMMHQRQADTINIGRRSINRTAAIKTQTKAKKERKKREKMQINSNGEGFCSLSDFGYGFDIELNGWMKWNSGQQQAKEELLISNFYVDDWMATMVMGGLYRVGLFWCVRRGWRTHCGRIIFGIQSDRGAVHNRMDGLSNKMSFRATHWPVSWIADAKQ